MATVEIKFLVKYICVNSRLLAIAPLSIMTQKLPDCSWQDRVNHWIGGISYSIQLESELIDIAEYDDVTSKDISQEIVYDSDDVRNRMDISVEIITISDSEESIIIEMEVFPISSYEQSLDSVMIEMESLPSTVPNSLDYNVNDYCLEASAQQQDGTCCGICLDKLWEIRTVCGHHFHHHCLRRWMLRYRTCPMCRGNIA